MNIKTIIKYTTNDLVTCEKLIKLPHNEWLKNSLYSFQNTKSLWSWTHAKILLKIYNNVLFSEILFERWMYWDEYQTYLFYSCLETNSIWNYKGSLLPSYTYYSSHRDFQLKKIHIGKPLVQMIRRLVLF